MPRPPAASLASLATLTLLTLTLIGASAGAPAPAADFGSEPISNDCTDKSVMSDYYQCLDDKRDQARRALGAAVGRAIEQARANSLPQNFASAITHAQQHWLEWMAAECNLEGLIDGGSAAPTPGLERCELRMMHERLATVMSLQVTLTKLSAANLRGQARG